MTDLLSEVEYGRILGSFTAVAEDFAGTVAPDSIPLTGRVTFVPSKSNISYINSEGETASLYVAPVNAVISQGRIVGKDGKDGVVLLASNSNNVSASVLWNARISLDPIHPGEEAPEPHDFLIEVRRGEIASLIDVIKENSRVHNIALFHDAIAEAAAKFWERVESGEFRGNQGPPGPPGVGIGVAGPAGLPGKSGKDGAPGVGGNLLPDGSLEEPGFLVSGDIQESSDAVNGNKAVTFSKATSRKIYIEPEKSYVGSVYVKSAESATVSISQRVFGSEGDIDRVIENTYDVPANTWKKLTFLLDTNVGDQSMEIITQSDGRTITVDHYTLSDNSVVKGLQRDLTAQQKQLEAAMAQLDLDIAHVDSERERLAGSLNDLAVVLEDADIDLTEVNQELETLRNNLEAEETKRQDADSAAQETLAELDARLATMPSEEALATVRTELGNAKNVADAAKVAAEEANTAANAASQAALEAAGIAASKGRIIVQETEPQGADRTASNIWIKPIPDDPTTEIEEKAITYVYLSETDEWTPTTSSELAQAAQNALDAREAAQQAAQRAETAIANAANAQQAAEAAQRTANKATTDARDAHNAAVAAQEAADDALDKYGPLDQRTIDAQAKADAAQKRADAAMTEASEAKGLAQDAVREVGDTVRNTVVEYAVGTSETVAPTSGWSTSTPTRTPGSFVWMRTIVTYADGDTSTTSPALLTGNAGEKGDTGPRGADGVAGKDGVGLSGTALSYALSTSGTVEPTSGWTATVPTPIKGRYLWTRTTWTYTDSTTETGYSVAYLATDGAKGDDGIAGKDGVGIKSTTITYAASSSGTVAPTTGWAVQPPAASAGQYVWTKTVWTYTDSSTETGYSVGKIGDSGPAGAKGDTGPKGSTGEQGVSVSSVTPFFRTVSRTAGAPAQPSGMTPSGWLTTEPAWNPSSKLYRAERIVYSNGTVSWTEPTLVAAYEGIVQVQSSVNGKNAITSSTSAPTSSTPGVVAGDAWYRVDSNGDTMAMWIWSGTAWVSSKVRNEMLDTVDVNKLKVFGTASMEEAVINKIWADGIAAKALTTNKLVVATGNLVPDGDEMATEEQWSPLTRDLTDKPASVIAARKTAPGQVNIANIGNQPFPVTPGQEYSVQAWVKADKPGSVLYIEIRDTTTGAHAGTGTITEPVTANTSPYFLFSRQEVPTEWTLFRGTWTPNEGVTSVRLGTFYFNHSAGTERGASVSIAGLSIRPKVGAVLIENGAISASHITSGSIGTGHLAANAVTAEKILAGAVTTDKMVANSISGDRIRANTLDAGKITSNTITATQIKAGAISATEIASRTITADKITAGTITSNEIKARTITAAEIATGTITANELKAESITADRMSAQALTVIGQTVVNDINVKGKLIGTDGVFTGTVDFANINVTGTQIVNKLGANSISADKISGGSFSGNRFTGGTFEGSQFIGASYSTSNTPSRDGGVMIDPTYGIRGWAANSGGQKFRLNAQTGQVSIASSITMTDAASGDGIIINPQSEAQKATLYFARNNDTSRNSAAIWRDRYTADEPEPLYLRGAYGSHVVAQGGLETRNGGIVTDYNISGALVYANKGLTVFGKLFNHNIATTSAGSNCYISSGNEFAKSTSSRRYKKNIVDWSPDADAVLALQPRQWQHSDPNHPEEIDERWHVGFIAEEVDDLGLKGLVSYEGDGKGDWVPEALNYDRFAAAHQVVLKKHEDEIKSLEDKLDALTEEIKNLRASM